MLREKTYMRGGEREVKTPCKIGKIYKRVKKEKVEILLLGEE